MMTGIEEKSFVFMVSDLSDQQMSQMEEAIVKLGGRMTTSFDPLATHLITSSVAPTEKKVLLSAASGLWLLHPSFVTESLTQGKWVEEEKFEWGNQLNGFLKGQEEVGEAKEENTEMKLAAAARHWRENLRIFRDNRKAFSDMKAMLVMPDEKKSHFEELITAGGGQVVHSRGLLHHDHDDTDASEVTHVFSESAYIRNEKVDYYGLAMRRIPVLNPLFLYDLLTHPFKSMTSRRAHLTNHMLEEAKPHWMAHLNVAEEFLNSCFNGNLEGVQSALQSGVDVNSRDNWDSERANSSGIYPAYATGKTGLMWAVMRKHNTVVDLLLRTPGININAVDQKAGMSALHMAVPHCLTNGNSNPEGLALLLACEDLDHNKPNDSNHPLWCAVESGARECIQLLLSDPRIDPNIPMGASLRYAVKESNGAAFLEPYI